MKNSLNHSVASIGLNGGQQLLLELPFLFVSHVLVPEPACVDDLLAFVDKDAFELGPDFSLVRFYHSAYKSDMLFVLRLLWVKTEYFLLDSGDITSHVNFALHIIVVLQRKEDCRCDLIPSLCLLLQRRLNHVGCVPNAVLSGAWELLVFLNKPA